VTLPTEEELQGKLVQARQKLDLLRSQPDLSFDERLDRLKLLSEEIASLHAELKKLTQPQFGPS
jgi:uncharacterized small protein (DUF1192 family)